LSTWPENGITFANENDYILARILRRRGCQRVQASKIWLSDCGTEFSAGSGTVSYAHLTHYTAEYREWGNGPTLVLVPGLAGGIDLLAPLIRELSSHFRVISYQLRGESACFALRRPFEILDLAADLDEFLSTQRIESPILMRVSFGGLIALEYAARFPHRIEKLIVQGVGARFEKDLLKRVAGMVLSRIPLPADSPFINQFFNLLFGGPQKQSTPLFRFVTRQCWQTDQSMMAHRFQLAERFNMGERLQRIRTKTLVLSGERDVLVSNRGLEELNNEIRDSLLVQIPHSGHLAPLTHTERVVKTIGAFA